MPVSIVIVAAQARLPTFTVDYATTFSWKVYGDAEDLVQATMDRATSGTIRFDGRSSLGAYLLGIARFRLYEHHRQQPSDERTFDSSAEPSDATVVSNVQPEKRSSRSSC
jgi:DNA-directed RNA polymerase specialized sigma24 family protein